MEYRLLIDAPFSERMRAAPTWHQNARPLLDEITCAAWALCTLHLLACHLHGCMLCTQNVIGQGDCNPCDSSATQACVLPDIPQCPPAPAVTHLRGSHLEQLRLLLAQPTSAAHPLVLDLGGHVLCGQAEGLLLTRRLSLPNGGPRCCCCCG